MNILRLKFSLSEIIDSIFSVPGIGNSNFSHLTPRPDQGIHIKFTLLHLQRVHGLVLPAVCSETE